MITRRTFASYLPAGLLPLFPVGKYMQDKKIGIFPNKAPHVDELPYDSRGPFSMTPVNPRDPNDPRLKPRKLLRQGPTMDQLINLKNGEHAPYYLHVLNAALRLTGILVSSTGPNGHVTVYDSATHDREADRLYRVYLARPAELVLVPESLLKHFRPENRGEEFPRGIPFEALKP